MSVTDDVSSQVMNKAEAAPQMLKSGVDVIKGSVDTGKSLAGGAASGIALIFKAPKFTADVIMKAVGKMTKNPKYYSQNVSIAELSKNSDIRQVDTGLTKSEMRYFEKACKKYNITYNAVVDKSDKSNPKEQTYYIFFKGKEASVIEQAMKESYKNYMKDQARPRFSVKAKLAFFRDRVAARDSQQDIGKEKHNNRADRQR